MNQQNSLSVALLISDMGANREISRVFKKLGVVPHFYETLKDYWTGILDNVPTLSIVDVKMMSDGDLFLQEHPFVKKRTVPLVFYYTSETEALASVAFDCFNYGMLKHELGFNSQLKSILKRVNHFAKLISRNGELEEQSKGIDAKVHHVVRANQKLQEVQSYSNLLNEVLEAFDQNESASFIDACDVVFEKFSEVKSFSCLQLSNNRKRLVSLDSKSSKYKVIPALWLGKFCEEGVEPFAQNLASQVTFELMGDNLICLNISSTMKYPEMLIFIQCHDQGMLNAFNWDSFEKYLSGIYQHYKLKTTEVSFVQDGISSPWELMSRLDSFAFGKLPGDQIGSGEKRENQSLINLDFSTLVDFVRSKKGVRFYWKEFFRDFSYRLDQLEIPGMNVVSMGVEHIGVIIPMELSEEGFLKLKGMTARFSYWRYFEDTDLVMAQALKPSVRMVPLSSEGYFSAMEDLSASEKEITADSDLENKQQLIWAKAPEQSV